MTVISEYGDARPGATRRTREEPSALHVRSFVRQDWPWVRRWFEDPALDNALGPLDHEWLEYVLADHTGVQLVVEGPGGDPVALVGVAWDSSGAAHGVTDFAVDPGLRRTGIGRAALTAALAWPGHPETEKWIAFVEPHNLPARRFFSALGWIHDGLDEDMHAYHLPSSALGTAPATVATPHA